MFEGVRTRCIFVILFLMVGIVGNVQPMAEFTAQFKALGLYEKFYNPDWDTTSLEHELAGQYYDALMPKLYWFFTNKKESVVIDWVTKMSELGHVPLLYLLSRNFYNLSLGSGVLSTQDLQNGLAYVMITLIRVQQDIACSRTVYDVKKAELLYKLIKEKFWRWYGDHIKTMKEEEKVFAIALQQVATWFNKRDLSKIHPVWVLHCTGRRISWGIDFATPSLEDALKELTTPSGTKIAQGFAEARNSVYQDEMRRIAQCKTFTQFFADATRRTSKDQKIVERTGLADTEEPVELGVAKAPGTYVVSKPEPEVLGDSSKGQKPGTDTGVTAPGTAGQETTGAVQDAGTKSLPAQLLENLVYYGYRKWVTQAQA